MTGLNVFLRITAVFACLSVLGGAYVWHRTILAQAVDDAEARGRREAVSAIRTQRRAEVARIAKQAAEDRKRAEKSGTLIKELANVASIDDDCHVSGDVLQLLDAVGTGSPSSS